jgi:hypothetical protein
MQRTGSKGDNNQSTCSIKFRKRHGRRSTFRHNEQAQMTNLISILPHTISSCFVVEGAAINMCI